MTLVCSSYKSFNCKSRLCFFLKNAVVPTELYILTDLKAGEHDFSGW